MDCLTKLFGDVLLGDSKTGSEVKTASLATEGKVIMMYFSGHWCPPCRAFTPLLIKFYERMKAGPNADLFDIIFVSSDRNEEAFLDFYSEMPWMAVPFSFRNVKAELARKYKINGVPSVVVIDGFNGKLITSNGRHIIATDCDAKKFPWKPSPVQDILGADFIRTDGSRVPFSHLKGKVVALYFSANWCPPCRSFTPALIRAYNNVNKLKQAKFEVIYVSSDYNVGHFQDYFGIMPWLAISPDDSRRAALADCFDVTSIPRLVILDENWQVVCSDGRMAVMADEEAVHFPWKYQPLNTLHEQFGRYLNDAVCLVYFTDGSHSQMSMAKSALEPISKRERERAEAAEEEQSMHYFIGTPKREQVYSTLIKFLGLPNERPMVVIMDCVNRVYYYYTGSLQAQGIDLFVGNYWDGKLDKHDIKQEAKFD